MTSNCSYVVTGGGRGVGRAIAERLVADGGSVVVIELDGAALRGIPRRGVRIRNSSKGGRGGEI